MVLFKRTMVVSYRLSIMTIALLQPFGCNLLSNVSDAQSTGVGLVTSEQNLGKGLTDVRQLF